MTTSENKNPHCEHCAAVESMTDEEMTALLVERMPAEFDGQVHIVDGHNGELGYVVYQNIDGTAEGMTPKRARELGCELIGAADLVEAVAGGLVTWRSHD